MTNMRFIETPNAPLPAGHYSQAVCANGFVFVAGLLPILPQRRQREVPEGITGQAAQVFANLHAVLQAAGTDLQHVVSMQIYVSAIESWGEINHIYTHTFGAHKPARTIIPCGPLHYGVALEANAVAVLP